jgi:hypothetical protein
LDAAQQISFRDLSEGLRSGVPPDWNVTQAYVDDLGLAGARGALIDAVNAGVALTSFVGHSGPTVWTFSGLFNATDASALTNIARPTIVSQWGCWNAYYVAPTFDTLGHKFMLSGNQGAAAVLGASTLTEVDSDRALGYLLTPRLLEPGMTIGRAVLEAKRELAATRPDLKDVLLGFTILGDPALSVEP